MKNLFLMLVLLVSYVWGQIQILSPDYKNILEAGQDFEFIAIGVKEIYTVKVFDTDGGILYITKNQEIPKDTIKLRYTIPKGSINGIYSIILSTGNQSDTTYYVIGDVQEGQKLTLEYPFNGIIIDVERQCFDVRWNRSANYEIYGDSLILEFTIEDFYKKKIKEQISKGRYILTIPQNLIFKDSKATVSIYPTNDFKKIDSTEFILNVEEDTTIKIENVFIPSTIISQPTFVHINRKNYYREIDGEHYFIIGKGMFYYYDIETNVEGDSIVFEVIDTAGQKTLTCWDEISKTYNLILVPDTFQNIDTLKFQFRNFEGDTAVQELVIHFVDQFEEENTQPKVEQLKMTVSTTKNSIIYKEIDFRKNLVTFDLSGRKINNQNYFRAKTINLLKYDKRIIKTLKVNRR